LTFLKLSMRKTGLVLTTAIIFLGIYDLVAVLVNPDTSTSISAYLVNVGFNRPFVVFTLGYISGHLTGYLKPIGHYVTKLKENEMIEKEKP